MVKVCKFGAQMVQFGNFCAPKLIIVVNLFYLVECAGSFNRKIFDYFEKISQSNGSAVHFVAKIPINLAKKQEGGL